MRYHHPAHCVASAVNWACYAVDPMPKDYSNASAICIALPERYRSIFCRGSPMHDQRKQGGQEC